jgi:nucleoside 2-deoxyribosyltransferase
LKKKLYLANPYGFSKQTKSLWNEFINIFKGLNIEVYEPFERTKQIIKKKR